jgi:hypothetical protein
MEKKLTGSKEADPGTTDETALEADFVDVPPGNTAENGGERSTSSRIAMDLRPDEEQLDDEELLDELEEEVYYAEPDEPRTPFEEFFDALGEDADETATIIVYRKQDPKNTSFRIPCTSPRIRVCTMVWASSQGGPEEFYEALAQQEGGGYYDFQIRSRRGFSDKKWEKLISDPAKPSERELTARGDFAKESEQHASQSFAPSFPTERKSAFEEMKETLKQAEEIRGLLGIDDKAPGGASEDPRAALPVKDQIKLMMVENMLNRDANVDGELKEKVFNAAFDMFQKGDAEAPTTWLDVAREAVKRPESVINVFKEGASLLGTILRRPSPPNTAVPSYNIPLPAPIANAAPVPEQPADASIPLPQPGTTSVAAPAAPRKAIKRVAWR